MMSKINEKVKEWQEKWNRHNWLVPAGIIFWIICWFILGYLKNTYGLKVDFLIPGIAGIEALAYGLILKRDIKSWIVPMPFSLNPFISVSIGVILLILSVVAYFYRNLFV